MKIRHDKQQSKFRWSKTNMNKIITVTNLESALRVLNKYSSDGFSLKNWSNAIVNSTAISSNIWNHWEEDKKQHHWNCGNVINIDILLMFCLSLSLSLFLFMINFHRWFNEWIGRIVVSMCECVCVWTSNKTFRQWKKKKLKRSDTDHGFYLLAGQVINNGRSNVSQSWRGGKQTVYSNFGGSTNIGRLIIVIIPFGNI